MQWLIDIAREAMEQWIYDNGIFRDRGDPAGWDFTEADIVGDFAWHDMDLSAIVGENAKAVLLNVLVKDAIVAQTLDFRKNGNVNWRNTASIFIQVANIWNSACLTVPCDANRIIEYNAGFAIFDDVRICVMGWWL